jgi:hypothetical protein
MVFMGRFSPSEQAPGIGHLTYRRRMGIWQADAWRRPRDRSGGDRAMGDKGPGSKSKDKKKKQKKPAAT